ncbi:PREDICTED: uncharacterized protein LOC104790730 isoform X5 [Camelina sativa]|uniref:Uncharacterized protein LOC104790730 isoform X2 n=1 Tax=Camelina sativa TaxID=90675 RepID=A0ABM0ZEZ0_CAMSA|nr:PREDICTED: uncharacterized protein LOC104790730 isoform X2 [Camelina sativa]XP_010514845.1 PREDICTED: uncharacterized protein LOC104790730 isoform X5 [Camelina sativa]
MGGLLHLFDFHNNSFSRKVFSHHKSRDEDLEAPRNSFELQVDNFQTYHNEKDKPNDKFEEEEWYERSCYPIEESMKKKIIDELSKKHSNDKHNTPSLVAKLMGMDALPLDSAAKASPWIYPRQSKPDHRFDNDKGGRKSRKGRLSSSTVTALDVMETPMRREHPQEEELQRFRREFEAWQADKRFQDCSRIVDSGCVVARDDKERLFTRTRSFGRDFNLISDRTAPTRIVVLRPGLQRAYDYEDSLTTSSGTTMEGSRGSSIEEFLEEVKERLKGELQGKAALKRSSSVRGSGIETPFSERPSPRSEPMRPYGTSEVQCNAPDSPTEFISRDTRKLLAERLKNVLRKEMSPSDDSMIKCSSRLRPTVSDAAKQIEEINMEDLRVNRDVPKKESSSPRNLKRSLSAPVSGMSFGKLLLEDRHVLTGAQIMRKHEATITEREETETETETEQVVVDPIRRKERFNLRKKVSSFRSTLRGRIFGKKIRSMIESNSFEDESIKDFVTGSKFNNFYDRNENSTEVPPSPASVCSSTPDEFWRNVDYLSQVSTPDVTVSDENGMPQVFRDISSNLTELRRQINELESDVQVRTPVDEEPIQEIDETIVDLGNPDKAFVRDLLVASGLYEGTSDISLSRWDPLAKLIKRSVLEETKENLKKSEENHNILFDLLNEVLTVVLGPLTKSGFKRKLMSSSVSESTTIRGKYLLESTWRIMSEYLYSQPEKPFCSLDGIIGWDMDRFPWSGLIGEEVNVLGREVEGMIMADLVEELVKDLKRQRS